MTPVFLLGGFGNNVFQICLYISIIKSGRNDLCINTYFMEENFITRILKWNRHKSDMTLKVLKLIPNATIESKLTAKGILCLSKYFIMKIFRSNKIRIWDGCAESRIGYLGYYQEGAHLNVDAYNFVGSVLSELFSADNIQKSKVAIHARRGDFIGLKNSSLGDQIDMARKFTSEAHSITIVTDDRNAIINDIAECECEIEFNVLQQSPEEDFKVLMSTEHLICSPSTFCYWAFSLGSCRSGAVPKILSNGAINNLPYFKPVELY